MAAVEPDRAHLRERISQLEAENSRLAAELRGAREWQKATAEVLEVISRAPSDLQTALDAVVLKASRLLDSERAVVLRVLPDATSEAVALANKGEVASWARLDAPTPEPDRGGIARVVREGRTRMLHGGPEALEAEAPLLAATWRQAGLNSSLTAPLLTAAGAFGVLVVSRSSAEPHTDEQVRLFETFASQAVIAIENARLFNELQERNREVTQALDRQTAVADVLQVISRKAFDLDGVLATLTAIAQRLLGATGAVLSRRLPDGAVEVAATSGLSEEDQHVARSGAALRVIEAVAASRAPASFTIPASAENAERRDPLVRAPAAQGGGWVLAAPLIAGGEVVGVLAVRREIEEEFTPADTSLLQTFADQAVIAMENARLFNELQDRNRAVTEALERQTATAEVLEIIAGSPTELRPVAEAIAERLLRISGADETALYALRGGELTRAAVAPAESEQWWLLHPPVTPGSTSGRALLDGVTVRFSGLRGDYWDEFPDARRSMSPDQAERLGREPFHTFAVPLMDGDRAIGTIAAVRTTTEDFSPEQVALAETFAKQAVIALQNARLFNELQDRNRAVTEALERQTAISEVLAIISSSPTDLQPVLDAVTERAAALCAAEQTMISFIEDGYSRPVSRYARPGLEPGPPPPSGPAPIAGRLMEIAVNTREPFHFYDTLEALEQRWPNAIRFARPFATDRVTVLTLPLLREQTVIGVIQAMRDDGIPFSEPQVSVLQAFADQAVIAIENARLFNELQERNREVTATASALRIVSDFSTSLDEVLNAVIAEAARICNARWGLIRRVQEGRTFSGGSYNVKVANVDRPLDADYLLDRAILEQVPLQFIGSPEEFRAAYPGKSGPLSPADPRGYSRLAVPIVRDGRPTGGMLLIREEARPFSDRDLTLIGSFTDQAAIAIENARLFNELHERNREVTEALELQTASSEVLRLISANPGDLAKVLDGILAQAAALCDAEAGTVMVRRGEVVRAEAVLGEAGFESLRGAEFEPARATLEARDRRSPALVDDLLTFEDSPGLLSLAQRQGIRSFVSTPLFSDDEWFGNINLVRFEVRPFTRADATILQQFADQAVIAIENARLFRELEEKTRELEIASRHKSEFMANMSHELRTPLNAIIGYSELLQEELADAAQDEFLPDLGRIHDAADHLLTLINDILDLSKVEAGRMTLYLEDFDVTNLVRDVQAIVIPLMERNGNAFSVHLPPAVAPMRADATKLRQALFNLLSNAAKFTEQGSVELRVSLDGSPPGAVPERIVFTVSDTGIGMTEQQVERLFQAFVQADASTTRRYGGTGLGLAISREFCRLMGGDITVESQPGAGSTFTMVLPLRVRDPAAPVPAVDSNAGAHRPAVLVIDDDPAARDLLRRTLEKEGYRVLEAPGGEEGLRLARTQPGLAAITLDVIMPGVDGWQVLTELKADPATASIPVIVLTMLDNTNLGFTLGATAFMTKPVQRERLTSLLREHSRTTGGPVLVVDDDEAVREMVRRYLTGAGWDVAEASDGRQALDAIAKRRPALILLDLVMPGLDGFGVVAELQAREEWSDIPVVVITGKDLSPEDREALNGGVQRVIQKGSIGREKLLAEVRSLVARAATTQGEGRSADPEEGA